MASSKTNEMRGPLTGIVHLSYVFVSLALSVMISYQLGVITRENFHLQNMAKDVDRMSTKTQADSDSSQVGSLAPLFWTSAEEYIEMGHTENDVRENGGVEIDQEGDDDDDEVDTYVTTRHFMFDLESVPRELIGSKSDIEQLIEEVTKECGAKLIVHGCSQQHQSISCLGILESKGHISIHAWPQKGAVLLDVMLPDSRLIDSVEKIYGIFHPNMPNYFDPRNGSENPVQASTWYVRPRANSNYNDDYEEAMGMHGDVKYKVCLVNFLHCKITSVESF